MSTPIPETAGCLAVADGLRHAGLLDVHVVGVQMHDNIGRANVLDHVKRLR